MNQLELVRQVRPDVAPLDAATRDRIAAAVFGDTLREARPPRWPKVTAIAAAIVLAATGAAALGRRAQPTPRLEPSAPASTVAESPSTSSTVTSTTVVSLTGARRPWAAAFDDPPEYWTQQQAALDAFMRRCMTDAGFAYTGNPFQTDSELADAMPAEPGSYVAAWYGVDGNGGCLHLAYVNMFGLVRSDRGNKPGELWGAWTRTALADPALLAQLDELASCARGLGIEVRDVTSRPDKAYNDVVDGLDLMVVGQAPAQQPLSVEELAAARAAHTAALDDLCPSYSAYQAALDAGIDRAALDWIDANPQEMAKLDAESADDMARFTYIIEHDGELPPS